MVERLTRSKIRILSVGLARIEERRWQMAHSSSWPEPLKLGRLRAFMSQEGRTRWSTAIMLLYNAPAEYAHWLDLLVLTSDARFGRNRSIDTRDNLAMYAVGKLPYSIHEVISHFLPARVHVLYPHIWDPRVLTKLGALLATSCLFNVEIFSGLAY